MTIQYLDKYITSSFIKKLFNILVVFVVIFLVVDIIDHIDKILDHNISFDQSYKISESLFKYHKVAMMVNSPVNNNASCIDPLL